MASPTARTPPLETIDYYRATAVPGPAHAALSGDVDCDTCVVGGGFAGINTALGLVERGHQGVVLLEAERLGRGASGRNGGFVFGGFSRGEDRLLADLGPARARALYAGTTDAVELIRARIDRYGIDCERTDAGVLWANWFDDPAVLRSRQRLLADSFGVEWAWVPRAEVRRQVHTARYGDALFEPRAFHFHPLKYLQGIARAAASLGAGLHERSPATGLRRVGGGWCVETPGGRVHARRVVLACGGYLAGLCGKVDAGVLPIATYAMATEPLGERLHDVLSTRAAIYDTRFAFDYYRPMADTRLLWGGRVSIRDRDPASVARLLRGDLLEVFPQLDGVRIDHAWSGLMSYARHEMPQVGLVGDDLWLAQAFGGHGVAPTAFAGELLASAIAEGDARWRELCDYGLVSALKPAGLVAAQLRYWWLQGLDAWKDWREG